MAEPVVIEFQAGGIANIAQAIKTVEDAIVRMGQKSSEQARRDRKNSEELASDYLKANEKKRQSDMKLAKLQLRYMEQRKREHARELDSIAAADRKAEEEKRKEFKRTADWKFRVQMESAKMAGRIADQEVKDEQRRQEYLRRVRAYSMKMEQGRLSGAAKEKEGLDAYRTRVRLTSNRWEQEYNDAQVAAARAGSEKRLQFARSVGGTVGGATSRAIGTVTRLAGTALALGGGFGIAGAVQSGMANEKLATSIANAGFVPTDPNNNFLRGAGDIMRPTAATAVGHGYAQSEVLAGLRSFVDITGDLTGGLRILSQMAELARATDTSFEDMAKSAAAVFKKTSDAGQTMDVLRAFAGQAKVGQIEFRQLSTYMPEVIAQSAFIQGDKVQNMKTLGALAQIAPSGGAVGEAMGAAESATSVNRMLTDMVEHERTKKGFLTKYGVHTLVGGPGGERIRNLHELLPEIMRKTGGNISALTDLFGERGKRVALGLSEQFQMGASAVGGTDNKAKIEGGVRQMMSHLTGIENQSLSQADINVAHSREMDTSSMKAAVAMERFNEAIQDKLLPVMPGLIDKFSSLIPAVQSVVTFFADHTFAENLATLIGASIGKEAVTAAVSAALRTAIGAAVGGTVGSLAISAGIAYLTVQALDESSQNTQRGNARGIIAVTNKVNEAMAAPITDEGNNQKRAALLSVEEERKRVLEQLSESTGVSVAEPAAITGALVGISEDPEDPQRARVSALLSVLDGLNKSMEMLSNSIIAGDEALRKYNDALKTNWRAPMILPPMSGRFSAIGQ